MDDKYQEMKFTLLLWIIILSVTAACSKETKSGPSENAIVIGALLPFSGEQAAVGFNMEEAVSLAIADVNAAGGVNGHPLYLVSRDSNSGSDAGYEQAKKMIYDQKIVFLIGPEENSLAKKLVSDIKKLDILNILPGFAAPVIRETGQKGGWLRLAPTPNEISCAMALHAVHNGYMTSSAIISADDYQTQLSTAFNTYFSSYGGKSLGTMTIKPDSDSFLQQIDALKDLDADLSLLMTYPSTGSEIIQEWTSIGTKTHWYLAPTLNTEMFLQNIPLGSLNEDVAFSPTLSLSDECELKDDFGSVMGDADTEETAPDGGVVDAGENVDTAETVDADSEYETVKYDMCKQDNFTQFSKHYGAYWGDDIPLPASLFYYDAVVLLAFGLTAAANDDHPNPTPTELRAYIRNIAEPPGETIVWTDLGTGFERIRDGKDISYYGAAAQYQFDGEDGKAGYGLSKHKLIDMWSIDDTKFIYKESIALTCKHL